MVSRVVLVVLAALLAICVAVPAEAGETKKKRTEVNITGVGWDPGRQEAGASGLLQSPPRCEPDRVVRVFAIRGGPPELLDVTVSDERGSWTGSGPISSEPDKYRAVAERKRISRRIVCEKGVDVYDPF